jgi:hypothetical protein
MLGHSPTPQTCSVLHTAQTLTYVLSQGLLTDSQHAGEAAALNSETNSILTKCLQWTGSRIIKCYAPTLRPNIATVCEDMRFHVRPGTAKFLHLNTPLSRTGAPRPLR